MNEHEDDTGDELDQGEVRERRSERRSRRRGGAGPMMSTISWRDIPAQLTARVGDEQHKVLLHARFQHAIDRAAAVAGLTSTHDYVQQWATANETLDADAGDARTRLDRRCAEIDEAWPRDRLEAFVANGGLDPSSGDGTAAGDQDSDDTHPDHRSEEETP